MVDTIVQIVQSVGFPIAMCVVMGYYVKYTEDKAREERVALQNEHLEEMTTIKDALANNTLALQELSTTIRKENVNE